MRLLALSDLHGQLPARLPECDVVAIAGDICPDYHSNIESGVKGFDSLGKQAHWLNTKFRAWADDQPCKKILAIPGNHDWVFQLNPELVPKDLRWELLIDKYYEFEGKRFYGTPWVPRFYDWAFMCGERNLEDRFAYIDGPLDMIIMHGPPLHCCDSTYRGDHAGSGAARSMIDRVKPRFVICGHIHEGYGVDYIGPTEVRNVASVDEYYELRDVPYVEMEL